MNKKYKDMTPAEQEAFKKANPVRVMIAKGMVIVAGLTVMAFLFKTCVPSNEPVAPRVPWEKMTYEQKDSVVREIALGYELRIPGIVEPYLKDADADVNLPSNLYVIDAEDHYCRYKGNGTAKNGFGVTMRFNYTVDMWAWKDSVRYGKVEVSEN